MGSDWRPEFSESVARRELRIIKDDLHCNAVRICGLDIDRLVVASRAALDAGLEVWFCPEMWDRGEEETLAYLGKAAEAAEELRVRSPGRVALSVGSESSLFMQGIFEGGNVFERLNKPSFFQDAARGSHNAPLNSFLKRARDVAGEAFHGPLTYFSVPLESVDWSRFDYSGFDLYRDGRMMDTYGKMAAGYKAYGKPVLIGEFGCCTYRGADMLGGNGFIVAFGMMADYLGPRVVLPRWVAEMLRIVPRENGHYIRDETVQARALTQQLQALDSAGVDGAFVCTFVAPASPHNEDPRFDGDIASYSLVKSYPDRETARLIASQSARQAKDLLGIDLDPETFSPFEGEVGRKGETYPDMSWEPKESFRAVAAYYAKTIQASRPGD